MAYTRDELRWNGWGLRQQTFDLRGNDARVWSFIAETVGLSHLPETPARPLGECSLRPSRLSSSALEKLKALTSVAVSDSERAAHALGRSYPDLIRLREGDLESAPDAVVYPANHDETAAVLKLCAEEGIAAIPFGGGSSVVGGVEATTGAHAASITIDTTRMDRLLSVDPVSQTATFQAGIWGPDLEEALQRRGFTLGHYPQSFEFSTLGGWIAARGAGQQSNRYGAANKWLVAARVATPTGEWRTLPFPQSAAGPDLTEVICGSEGTLGVITEATVKLHPVVEARDYRAYLFRSFEAGANAIREIVQRKIPVAMMRLSDADETYFFGTFKSFLKSPKPVQQAAERVLSQVGFGRGRCVLMIGHEGAAGSVRKAWPKSLQVALSEGGLPVGGGPGKSWFEQRFAMPYLRDPMLDRGVGVDTLETSTSWSNLHRLYDGVRSALRDALGPNAAILTHISHSYTDGASLYFTFFFARDVNDPLGQWRILKRAASNAIAECGGTISHHHGVGQDHAEWFAPEKGERAVGLLAAAKAELDPEGVLNPGKLFRS
ncbi:MAG: FAD-binding oxidoreductase [Myxococcota bacterium]